MAKTKEEKKGTVVEVAGIDIIKELRTIRAEINEIKELVGKEGVTEMNVPAPKVEEPEVANTVTNTVEIPVPLEYRQIINEVLNDKFGIKIEPLADRPQFNLIIIVPEEYSTMRPEEKEMYKQDLRSKILSYADGVNGIRQYAELVFSSFNPTIQAKIRL